MKRLAIFAACALLFVSHAAAAQQVKIAYVNGQKLQRESKMAQRAAESLRAEFSARERELSDMRSRVAGMQSELGKLGPNASTLEAQKKQQEFATLAQRFEQTRRTFEEDVARRRGEEREKFFKALGAVVDKIAKAQKFDLVLFHAVYASPAMDITNQVMKALDGS